MPSILREHSPRASPAELPASDRRYWTFNTRKQLLPHSSMGTEHTIKCMTCNISWGFMRSFTVFIYFYVFTLIRLQTYYVQ